MNLVQRLEALAKQADKCVWPENRHGKWYDLAMAELRDVIEAAVKRLKELENK